MRRLPDRRSPVLTSPRAFDVAAAFTLEAFDPGKAGVRQATALLQQMDGYEEGLRRRTEGITWLVWGFVLAGLSLSYYAGDLARALTPDDGGPKPWTLLFPWSPWALAGGVATMVIWRSAALHVPALSRPWWQSLAGLLAVGAGIWIVFLATWLLPAGAQRVVTGPTLMGVAGLLTILLPILRLTSEGRRVGVIASAALVVGGAAIGLADLGMHATGIASTALAGGAWLAAGAWQASRG